MHARAAVEKRDKGVCSECGLDTEKIVNTLRRLGVMARQGLDGYDRTSNKAAKRYKLTVYRLHQIVTAAETDFEAAQKEIERERRQALGHPLQPQRYRMFPPEPVTVAEQRIRTVHRRLMRLAAARLKRVAAELLKQGFDGVNTRFGQVDRSLWDADHITPVVKGGGGCGLENYRTLCQPCHKAATKRLAAERAAERRGVNPQTEFALD